VTEPDDPYDPDTVRRRLADVRQQIGDAGGEPDRISVLAVTKGFGPGAVVAALDAGLPEVGENYAQELVDKAEQLAADHRPLPHWHFIGRLQSNKVRVLAEHVVCWQSVDRASLVDELGRRVPRARIMVQVNATGEDTKGGAAPADVPDLVARARDAGLDVAGLMTVGVLGDDAATAEAFAHVSDLADRLELPERSMGMSGDLPTAVRAGTTMVRVGTALFGPRPPR
jgi:pyridoxal phosphate enzyme (YggS family)